MRPGGGVVGFGSSSLLLLFYYYALVLITTTSLTTIRTRPFLLASASAGVTTGDGGEEEESDAQQQRQQQQQQRPSSSSSLFCDASAESNSWEEDENQEEEGDDDEGNNNSKSHNNNDPVCHDLKKLLVLGSDDNDNNDDVVFCNIEQYKIHNFTSLPRGGSKRRRGFNFGNPNCGDDALVSSAYLRAIIRPRDAQDVSTVVKYVVSNQNNNNLSLSVRSGGHSYTCNFLKPNSIHLDLRSLDHVEIIPNDIDTDPVVKETELVRMGTGNTFEDLFQVIDRNQYSFVHGECVSVGVGGYYLHGGTHGAVLSSLYGFGNESIRSMEVVTGDGSILKFTEPRRRQIVITDDDDDSNHYGRPVQYVRDRVQVTNITSNGSTTTTPVVVEGYEGFWDAIRTAGSSFGIVTELTVQLYREPEPYTWFINLPLTQPQLFKLLDDALHDPSIQVNAGDSAHVWVPLRSLFQLSLKDGPRDPQENYKACVDWLKNWLDTNGIWWLRWNWSRRFFESFTNLGLRIVTGRNPMALTADRRMDLGSFYPSADEWVTSSVWLPWSNPNRERLMAWYRDKALRAFGALYWLAIVPFDRRNTPINDFVLFVEFTIWPAHKYRDWIRDMDRELEQEFPEVSRYYNVPIAMETDEEDSMMTRRYFPNLDQLRLWKAEYDPQNIFAPYQGITPASGEDKETTFTALE